MLAYYNPLWRKVIEILRRKHAFGPSVQLACQKHPEMNLDIAIPEHFDKVSSLGTYDYVLLVSLNLVSGGCSHNCGDALPVCTILKVYFINFHSAVILALCRATPTTTHVWFPLFCIY